MAVRRSITPKKEARAQANALYFRRVASIPANGNGPAAYALTDPAPLSGRTYYRIRQVDRDETFSYSRLISLAAPGNSILQAYPNPAGDRTTIEMSAGHTGSVLKLVNTSGILLREIEVSQENVTVDLTGLAPGLYLIRTEDGTILKIVKE